MLPLSFARFPARRDYAARIACLEAPSRAR